MVDGSEGAATFTRRRLVLAYALMAAALGAVAVVSFVLGSDKDAATEIAGIYRLEVDSQCMGPAESRFEVQQSGSFANVEGADELAGKLRVESEVLEGPVTCRDGSEAELDLPFTVRERPAETEEGKPEREITLEGTVGAEAVTAALVAEPPEAGSKAKLSDEDAEAAAVEEPEPRSGEETFGRLMLAIAAIILAARLAGVAMRRIGQPQVMGEILAGILLGPTLLGAIAPEAASYLFPDDIVPLLSAGADIGLAFYMFLVGLEVDPALLRGRVAQAALVSNASVALPMALGLAVALPLYTLVGPDTGYGAFALFIGVAMSITAFPVLARILVERRMLKRPVGALALASAAIDDVTAWGLLAVATAIAASASATSALETIGLSIAFCIGMAVIGRRLLGRLSTAYDEAGHLSAAWIGAIFVGVLVSAYVASSIGIAAIFGAFVMGLIMPRRADLAADVTKRVESFVVTVLLPLFFVTTGLKTEIGLLDRPELWLLALLILVVAIAGKWIGATAAARFSGLRWRESTALGTLMNARGLTELIVLNIALEAGVITPALFAMLVLMALVTTFMTAPLLRVIDPRGTLSAPVEEELRQAQRSSPEAMEVIEPRQAILVAPQEDRNVDRLLWLAEPLALAEPRRELIIASLIVPARISTGPSTDDRELARVATELDRLRENVVSRVGLAVRSMAFTSADPGRDLVRLASEHEVDLILVDGRRPLLGEGIPRGAVGTVLDKAPCDVAVLVESDAGPPDVDREHPVVVPFGGAEHDWAALELAAWIASVRNVPLRLLGAAATADGERDASRLLANASLVVQRLAGIATEPVLVDPGRRGVLGGAADAGLLVVGLSGRWRSEGLGPVRSAIAKSAPAPTVFVRRGARPGALSPPDDMTRFTWSGASAGDAIA